MSPFVGHVGLDLTTSAPQWPLTRSVTMRLASMAFPGPVHRAAAGGDLALTSSVQLVADWVEIVGN